MKKKMPSEGLRLGRDSGSILCDTLKKWRFRTGWGGGKYSLTPIAKDFLREISYVIEWGQLHFEQIVKGRK